MKFSQLSSKPINWLDEIKSAQDPIALSNLYIKNLKEELKILETQNKVLKTKLGTFDFEAKKKKPKIIEEINQKSIKKIEIGEKTSDYAKYPTTQKLSSVFIDQSAYQSSAVRIEYIRELELLIDALKIQNKELKVQISQIPFKKQQQKVEIVVPKKYEGHDCINDEILISKSNLIHTTKFKPIHQTITMKPDNTLKDRQIQNLIEEKNILEKEISMYKETKKTRQSKLEGNDINKQLQKQDKNSIIYAAKLKYIHQEKKDEELKEKYLKALIQETFLLQQQLSKLKEESQYFDPHKQI